MVYKEMLISFPVTVMCLLKYEVVCIEYVISGAERKFQPACIYSILFNSCTCTGIHFKEKYSPVRPYYKVYAYWKSAVVTLYDNFTYVLSQCFVYIRATYKYDHPVESLQRVEYDF